MGEIGGRTSAAGARGGRALVGAVVWFMIAGVWLWAAIVGDGIAGPLFFLNISAVCLCLAVAAQCCVVFRRRIRLAHKDDGRRR
jgi:uncharacterized membrane protein YccF (DUF307 family)